MSKHLKTEKFKAAAVCCMPKGTQPILPRVRRSAPFLFLPLTLSIVLASNVLYCIFCFSSEVILNTEVSYDKSYKNVSYVNHATPSTPSDERLAQAIFLAEGGHKTKFHYSGPVRPCVGSGLFFGPTP